MLATGLYASRPVCVHVLAADPPHAPLQVIRVPSSKVRDRAHGSRCLETSVLQPVPLAPRPLMR